jgi:hypothetical protein
MPPSVAQGQPTEPQAGSPPEPCRTGRAARVVAHSVRAVLLALGAFWLFGAVLFLRADGTVDYTLPRREAPPQGEHNLASYLYGPRVRASSYFRDAEAHHHPMFLVDGRARPSLIEKWACSERDQRPWLSISWREPHDLRRVRIEHAGLHEADLLSARKYRLRCLTKDGVSGELLVQGNLAGRAEHALVCAGVLGLRIDFPRRRRGGQIVRVFEVEAWGR